MSDLARSQSAAAARAFGVAWPTAMDAVRDHGKPRIDHLSRLGAPTAIGLDETSWLAATATHPTLLVTGIVDLDRGQLVDVIGARSASAVEAWLAAKPTRCAEQIRHAVIDPYQPYANALANKVPDDGGVLYSTQGQRHSGTGRLDATDDLQWRAGQLPGQTARLIWGR